MIGMIGPAQPADTVHARIAASHAVQPLDPTPRAPSRPSMAVAAPDLAGRQLSAAPPITIKSSGGTASHGSHCVRGTRDEHALSGPFHIQITS
jgi:hypothetical protein